ncbi:uncharacterized protein LOC114331896 isoform X2 [Diabrotica virgifera virgifera]|uniref:Uncharacterized protein LOC114331896 isoform X2 n=1 Tax=Diabrotica virgifera virgifera TaxID=50390 RepID=A0A6P7FMP9_DIAVI|nr:uncharacterized protein LOC114331896 isoform X2 [Diabrotica virgifera virgifera]
MNRSRNHRGRRDASQSRGDETISNFSKSRSSSTENKNTGVYTLSHIKTESENSSEQESLSSETADLRGQTSSIISISRNWGPRGLRGERRGGYRRTNKKSDNPESGQTQNTWENSTSIKLASSKHEGGLGQQLELLKKETDLASLESCEKQSESSRKPKLIKNELSSARSEKSKEFTSLDPTEKPRALNNLDLSLTSLSEKQLINLGTSLKEFLNTQPARTKDSGERQRESSSTKVTQNIVKINTSIKKEIIKPNIDGDLVVSSTKKIASSMKTIPSSDKIISKKILDEAIIFFKEKHGPVNDATDLKVQPTGGIMVLPKRFLNRQTCGNCLNYLSVGPVTISNTRPFTVCGREECADSKKSTKSFPRLSLYNEIAKNYFFNCVYHYEGCMEIFSFSKNVEEHESLCKFKRTYKCLSCPARWNACQVIQHYKQNHPDSLAYDGVFELKTNKVLFHTDQQLLSISISLLNDTLNISCKQVNICSVVTKYKIIIFHPSSDIEFVSKPIDIQIESYSIDLHDLPESLSSSTLFGAIKIYCQEQAKEPIAYVKKTIDDLYTKILKTIMNLYLKSEIICCHCNNIIRLKSRVLFCPQSHVSCTDCVDDYCTICKTSCHWMDMKYLLGNFNLPCDWKKCNKQIKCLDFDMHKQICCKREYTCPELGCDFKGNRKELEDHWHSTIPLIFDSKIIIESRQNMYWMTDNLFELLLIQFKAVGKVLEVDEKFACFPNNYKLELMRKKENENIYKKFVTLAQKGSTKMYMSNLPTDYTYKLVVKLDNPGNVEDVTENTVFTQRETAESVLKRLLGVFMKINFKCSNCDTLINEKPHIYICEYSHIFCSNCLEYCVRCTSAKVIFTSLEKLLQNIKLSCDWPGCTQKIDCWNFLLHKQICSSRLYTFPTLIEGMEHFNGTKEKLQENWPKKGLKLSCGKELDFRVTSVVGTLAFWLTSYVNELLMVRLYFDKIFCLEVKETLAIFTNNYKIKLYEYNAIRTRYEEIEELTQRGNKKISSQGLKVSAKYRLTIYRT